LLQVRGHLKDTLSIYQLQILVFIKPSYNNEFKCKTRLHPMRNHESRLGSGGIILETDANIRCRWDCFLSKECVCVCVCASGVSFRLAEGNESKGRTFGLVQTHLKAKT